MIDIIMKNPVYDIGFIYNFGGLQVSLNALVKTRSTGNLTSTIKKNERAVYQEISDLLTNLGYKQT